MLIRFVVCGIMALILFVLNIYTGSVAIPADEITAILFKGADPEGPIRFIVVGSRLPQAVTALMAGAALTVAGLLLQTAFRNPLAGPSILGITSGASLGVALVMLLLGGTVSAVGYSWGGYIAIIIGALAGSLAIMTMLLLFSMWLKNDLMLLIVGILIGYLTSSVITLLNSMSTAEGIQGYTIWGMGSFNGVSIEQMPWFVSVVIIGLLMALMLAKPLNVLLLGDNYAKSLGINMMWVRNLLLAATGLLTAITTAYCGPISFIGLAVPHIVRIVFRAADHRIVIPACIVVGGAIGLLCNLLCLLPEHTILPLNGVTPLIGVPVILYVIFKGRRSAR